MTRPGSQLRIAFAALVLSAFCVPWQHLIAQGRNSRAKGTVGGTRIDGTVRGKAPRPRMPSLPASLTAHDLLPGVPIILKQGGIETISPGSSVLVVSDRSLDRRLNDAFQHYVAAAGARVDLVVLNGFPEARDLVDLFGRNGDNWWPEWLWEAVTQYDYVINMTYLFTGTTFREGQEISRWFRNKGIHAALSVRPSVEKLAYAPYNSFPAEIMLAINRRAVESVPSGKVRLHLTSPEGTDLWLDNDYSGELEELRDGGVPPYSLQISARPTQFMNARGKIVASALNTGMLETPVTLWIDNSQVQRVEGGDGVDSFLREQFEKLDSVDFGAYGGPGIRWLEEITFTTHPKDFGLRKDGDAFSALFDNWKGAHYRSGVVHISVGARGTVPPGLSKLYRYVFELYFPILEIDGQTIIDHGHLMALDDPGVRAVAARFGSAEEWLTEAWVPAVPGVNVP